MWDYLAWPHFRYLDSSEPDPDVRALVSEELAADLLRWGTDMCVTYADETGEDRPTDAVADQLDARFDQLARRLRAEGLDIVQGLKWWRGGPVEGPGLSADS